MYTGKQIASFLGKDPSTIRRWRRAMQDYGIPFEKDGDVYLFDDYAFRLCSTLADLIKDRDNYVLHDEVAKAIQNYSPDAITTEPLPQEKEVELVNAATLQAIENKWTNYFVELEEKVYEMAERLEEQNQLLIEHQENLVNLNQRDRMFMEMYRKTMEDKKVKWWQRIFTAGPVAE